MRWARFALPALAVTSLFATASGPVRAEDYPWCAQYSERMGGGRNCGFVTLDQCRATISGMAGVCEPNPRYTAGRGDHPQRRYKRDDRD